MIQNNHHDRRTKAKPKQIATDDSILICQKMTTLKAPFYPEPYAMTKVKRTHITLERGDSKCICNKNHAKKVAKIASSPRGKTISNRNPQIT